MSCFSSRVVNVACPKVCERRGQWEQSKTCGESGKRFLPSPCLHNALWDTSPLSKECWLQSFPSTYPGAVSFPQKHPVVLGTCCVEVDSEDSLRGQRHSGFSVSCTGTSASSELPLMLITVTVSEFELSTLKRSSLWISWLLALLLPKPGLVFWRHTRQFGDFDSWIWVI